MKPKRVHFEIDLENPPPLTEAAKQQLARLDAMPEAEIDFSDIPLQAGNARARTIRFRDRHLFRPVKKQVTLRLDSDVIEWFKAQQGGGRGYQTKINAALRKLIDGGRRKAG